MTKIASDEIQVELGKTKILILFWKKVIFLELRAEMNFY